MTSGGPGRVSVALRHSDPGTRGLGCSEGPRRPSLPRAGAMAPCEALLMNIIRSFIHSAVAPRMSEMHQLMPGRGVPRGMSEPPDPPRRRFYGSSIVTQSEANLQAVRQRPGGREAEGSPPSRSSWGAGRQSHQPPIPDGAAESRNRRLQGPGAGAALKRPSTHVSGNRTSREPERRGDRGRVLMGAVRPRLRTGGAPSLKAVSAGRREEHRLRLRSVSPEGQPRSVEGGRRQVPAARAAEVGAGRAAALEDPGTCPGGSGPATPREMGREGGQGHRAGGQGPSKAGLEGHVLVPECRMPAGPPRVNEVR